MNTDTKVKINCGIVYDPIFEKHQTGLGHPERTNRASFIFQKLKDHQLLQFTKSVPVHQCTLETLSLAHNQKYLIKSFINLYYNESIYIISWRLSLKKI